MLEMDCDMSLEVLQTDNKKEFVKMSGLIKSLIINHIETGIVLAFMKVMRKTTSTRAWEGR